MATKTKGTTTRKPSAERTIKDAGPTVSQRSVDTSTTIERNPAQDAGHDSIPNRVPNADQG